MKKTRYAELITKKYGKVNPSIVESLFEQAVEAANNGELDEAIEICNDAIVFYKYSTIGYEIICLLGLLSEIYLNNDQKEMAERVFRLGMTLIEDGKRNKLDLGSYNEDIDAFLDLKIKIDTL